MLKRMFGGTRKGLDQEESRGSKSPQIRGDLFERSELQLQTKFWSSYFATKEGKEKLEAERRKGAGEKWEEL